MKSQCNSCWKRNCHVYIQGERLVNLTGPDLERRINNCSIVKVTHIYKERQKGYAHLHFESTAESSNFFNIYAVNKNVFCPLLPIQVKPALTKGGAVLYNTAATNISVEDVPRKRVLCKCQPLAAPTPTEQTHTEPTVTATATATGQIHAEPTATTTSTSTPSSTPTGQIHAEPTATTTSTSTPSSTPSSTPTGQIHAEPTATTTSTSTSSSTPTPTELRPVEPTTTELVPAEDKPEAAWRACLKRSIEALEVDLKQKEQEVHDIQKKIKVLKEQL